MRTIERRTVKTRGRNLDDVDYEECSTAIDEGNSRADDGGTVMGSAVGACDTVGGSGDGIVADVCVWANDGIPACVMYANGV